MDKEAELILTKLRIVSEEEDRVMYLCDKEHSKILLDYITNLQEENEKSKNGIKELDDMFYETFRISQNGYFSISEWELKEFTDKLKELKGDWKE